MRKPTDQLNTTDVNQLKSILTGGVKRINYTSQIMTQMNEMVEYFSLNETGVAGLLDNSDVNVSV